MLQCRVAHIHADLRNYDWVLSQCCVVDRCAVYVPILFEVMNLRLDGMLEVVLFIYICTMVVAVQY